MNGVGTFIWTNGTPTHNPRSSGAKFAVDKNTYRWYEWIGGTTWIQSGDRIQRIAGCAAPDYTPTIHQSYIVINSCDPNPQLYAWNGTEWQSMGGGQSFSIKDFVSLSDFDVNNPLDGWTQPTPSGENDRAFVQFANCIEAQYVFDGSDWNLISYIQKTELGSTEAVTLPSFSGTGWTGSGTYSYNSALENILQASVTLEDQTTYLLSFTLAATSGAIWPYVGGQFGDAISASGQYNIYINGATDNRVFFLPVNSFNGSISNISLKKVIGCEFEFQTDVNFRGAINLSSGVIQTSPASRIAIGYNAQKNNTFDQYNIQGSSVAIGNFAGNDGSSTVVGYFAGSANEVEGVLTAMGKWAGRNNTTGHASFFGNACGILNETTDSHGFGDEACRSVINGFAQTGFGYYALNMANGTNPMTAMGHEALRNATSGASTGVGYYIGRNVSTGRVTGIGGNAAEFISTGNGIFIGYYAGTKPNDTDFSFTVEDSVIIIGDNTYKSDSSAMNNVILIGHNLRANVENSIKIGNSDNEYIEMYGKFGLNNPGGATEALHVIGKGRFSNLAGAANGLLFADSDGVIERTNINQANIVLGGVINNGEGVYFRGSDPLIPNGLENSERFRFLNAGFAHLIIAGDNGSNEGAAITFRRIISGSPTNVGSVGMSSVIFGGANTDNSLMIYSAFAEQSIKFAGLSSGSNRINFEIKNNGSVFQRTLEGSGTRLVQSLSTGEITATTIDPANIPTIIKASATLDFPSTGAHSSSDLTITVTGAAVGDVVTVAPGLAAISDGSCYTAWVSAANTVTVRFNHYHTGGSTDPVSAVFNIIVTKF
jgi:hypothetical protein